MPIRTDKGRHAPLRAVATWPLRSWRHLAATVAAAAVLVGGVAALSSLGSSPAPAAADQHSNTDRPPAAATQPARAGRSTIPPHTATPSPRSTQSSSPQQSSPPEVSSQGASSQGASPGGDPRAAAASAARAFVTRFARPADGTSPQEWMDRVATTVTPETVVTLRSINPDNVPITGLAGEPTVTHATDSVGAVQVPTNAGPVRVTAVSQPDGRWLVNQWQAG